MISWEGDSREVLREWPKDIRNDFGTSLNAMQEGENIASPYSPHAVHRCWRFLS